MKKLALVILLMLSPLLHGADITGEWISRPDGKFFYFYKDGTFNGDIYGQYKSNRKSRFDWLKDRSGIILYREGKPFVLDVRELTEERLVLVSPYIAKVLERPTREEKERNEKIVSEKSRNQKFINNLRQVASGGQQFLLEEGRPQVSYSEIVGTYFPEIKPINGESYKELKVFKKGGELVVQDKDGEVYKYRY